MVQFSMTGLIYLCLGTNIFVDPFILILALVNPDVGINSIYPSKHGFETIILQILALRPVSH